jgi:hypothetical protein
LAGKAYEQLNQVGAVIEQSATNLQNSAQVFHSSAQSLSSTNFDHSLKTFSQGLHSMGYCADQFQKTVQSMESHSLVQSLVTSTTTIANGIVEIKNSNQILQESSRISAEQKFMAMDRQITKATERLDHLVVKVESINAVNHHLLAIRKVLENTQFRSDGVVNGNTPNNNLYSTN